MKDEDMLPIVTAAGGSECGVELLDEGWEDSEYTLTLHPTADCVGGRPTPRSGSVHFMLVADTPSGDYTETVPVGSALVNMDSSISKMITQWQKNPNF